MEDQKIIDGKKLAEQHAKVLQQEIAKLPSKPKIVSILIGDDPSSLLYTQIKQKKAEEFGINFEPLYLVTSDSTWEAVCQKIKELNNDPIVQGIMVQLPLPKEFLGSHTTRELLDQINPQKDVDGLTSDSPYLPAAVKAVLSILKDEKIAVAGKNIAVLGASDLVGIPVARELTKTGGLVYVCDINTSNLRAITLEADIIVSATGTPGLVIGKMVKDGVVIIDVGSEKVEDKIVGDVDFNSVYPKVSKITPVPGGVGPMTVVSLMENVVQSVRGNV